MAFWSEEDVSRLEARGPIVGDRIPLGRVDRLPVILEEYVVGDATSLFKSIDEAAAVVRNGNDAIMRELEGTFERVLDMKLSTPEGRALVKAKLDLAVAIATPAVKEIVKAAAVAAL